MIASISWEKLIGWEICPWTLSVPESSQFTLSYAFGKLSASQNRYCPQTIYLLPSEFFHNLQINTTQHHQKNPLLSER